MLYNAFVKSHLTYSLPFLNTVTQTSIDVLKRKMSRCIKILFNLNPFFPTNDLYKFTNIQTIEELKLDNNVKFIQLALANELPLFVSGEQMGLALNSRSQGINLSKTGHGCDFWINCIINIL
jgi:hypothetical protein